jgi:AcrR family transcriptional regulator
MVLDAALRVFAEHGYRGTSMQAIANEAGVTKPVIYECFGSKDILLETLLEREEQRLLASVLAALPEKPAAGYTDAETMLTIGLTSFLIAACERPDSWRVVFQAELGRNTVVARRVERAKRTVVGQLRELFLGFIGPNGRTITDREADLMAELLISIAETAARLLIVKEQPWEPAELGRYLANLIAPCVVGRR